MDILKIDNIFARRSIRKFTTESLTSDQVTTLLKAAMSAPNAGNRQPWHFIAITDPAMRIKLAEIHPYAQMARQAPLVVIPCGEPGRSVPGREEFWIQDVSAATTTMLIAATGLGLGGVWCGVYPDPDRVAQYRNVLGIPERVIPLACVCIGHPDEQKEPRTQYDPERVHANHW